MSIWDSHKYIVHLLEKKQISHSFRNSTDGHQKAQRRRTTTTKRILLHNSCFLSQRTLLSCTCLHREWRIKVECRLMASKLQTHLMSLSTLRGSVPPFPKWENKLRCKYQQASTVLPRLFCWTYWLVSIFTKTWESIYRMRIWNFTLVSYLFTLKPWLFNRVLCLKQ